MRKSILKISLVAVLFAASVTSSFAQETPSEKKDSVNADQAAKPTFYDASAETKAPKSDSNSTYAIIGGVVVVLGAAAFVLTRKKKN